MIFSLASQSSQPSIKVHLGDTILEQVISYKYLGIDFDHKLSFASQTTRAVTKAKQGIGALCRTLCKWSSSKILNTAISSIAMPALLYGIETWFPPDVTKQIQVLKLQKYAARLLLNNFKEEISLVDLVNQVKWQPIHHIVATRRLLALRKYLEGTRYIDSEVFPLQIPESGIRKSSRLLERKYTNSIQMEIIVKANAKEEKLAAAQTRKMWNELDEDVVRSSVRDFACKIRDKEVIGKLVSKGVLRDFPDV